nr:hypothetical protein [uncultured Tateyamaria sp.]
MLDANAAKKVVAVFSAIVHPHHPIMYQRKGWKRFGLKQTSDAEDLGNGAKVGKKRWWFNDFSAGAFK